MNHSLHYSKGAEVFFLSPNDKKVHILVDYEAMLGPYTIQIFSPPWDPSGQDYFLRQTYILDQPYLFLRHCVDCRVSCVLCWLHCVCKKNRGQSGWSGGVSPIRGVDGKAVNEPNGNYNSWTTIERFKLSWEISVNSTNGSIFLNFKISGLFSHPSNVLWYFY